MKNLSIKQIRIELLLTQQELADKLGLSIVSIQRWESGKSEPSLKHKREIIALCKENNIYLGE